MKKVFVDTSGFYALLDPTDTFHIKAARLFEQAELEQWNLVTTNYVTHETWALVQNRLGWDALDALMEGVFPLCHIQFVDESLHALGSARCCQARERRLSLTDCISFEYCKREGIGEAIAQDEHFEKQKIILPKD